MHLFQIGMASTSYSMCLVGSSNRHRAGFERVKTDGLSCNTLAVSLSCSGSTQQYYGFKASSFSCSVVKVLSRLWLFNTLAVSTPC